MTLGMSEVTDTGDSFVVECECVKWEDVKEDADFQQKLQKAMEEDIDVEYRKFGLN